MNEYNEEKHEYSVDGKVVPSVTEICGILTHLKHGEINPSVLMQAAARGTAVHEFTELMDLDLVDEDTEIDPAIVPYVQAWNNFCNDWSPEWEFIEHKMWSPKYAGTADRIGIINGQRVIVDIKTTSTFDRPSTLSLGCQLAAYFTLFKENHEDMPAVIDGCMGVQLKKDGTYKVYMFEDIEEKYKIDCVSLFYELFEIIKIVKGIQEYE